MQQTGGSVGQAPTVSLPGPMNPHFIIIKSFLPPSVPLALRCTSLDEQDIAVLNNVVLALSHDLTFGLDARLITLLPQGLVVVHDDLNESLLEVTVDDTSSLGRLCAIAECPLSHLVSAGGEEGSKVELFAHSLNDLWQRRLGAERLALLLGLLLGLEAGQTLFERHRDGDDDVSSGVLLYPFSDLGKVLVLLPNVILLAEVDEVDDGLGREKEERVDDLDLSW